MVLEIVKPGWVDAEDLPIFSVDIHPSGTKFATGGQGNDCGRIVIWNMDPIKNKKSQHDPNTPKQLCQMENHLACVNAVRWSGDGKYLASAGDDKLVMLWTKSNYGGGAVFGGGGKVNHENYKCSSTLRQHGGDVLDLAWSPDDRYLASCSVDNTVIVWDCTGTHPNSVAVLRGHSSHVKGVTWDPVGKYLASQGADKAVRIWRTSDWKEESVIKEPFKECGGTTHVLRLNWSPDGQYIVTAHAMNSGGPTAQIIDRDGFKHDNDFVGHRKAVTCVRFNGNIFQSATSKNKNDNNYVCVAIGSRDRSISVWLTCLKRPLVVLNDLFDSSVMDLAWSKDGMTLIACSHDGRIAGLNFDESDIGVAIAKGDKNQLFKKLYGQASGITLSDRPVLIENAELLNLNDNLEDMFDFVQETNNSPTNTTQNGTPIKGPTDKQIEVRTSDGRRRITPMFIVPSVENGDVSNYSRNSSDSTTTASKLSSSSSTETKSKIRIERLDGVVRPNVSPGKNSNSNSNQGSDSDKNIQNKKDDTAPKPNMIQIKRKVGTTIVPVKQNLVTTNSSKQATSQQNNKDDKTANKDENKNAATKLPNSKSGNTPNKPAPKVNGIKHSEKSDEKSAKKSDKSEKSKDKDDDKIKGKKPGNRIESSSESSSSSSSSDSDSSDSDSSDETTASQTEKSGKSDADEAKAAKTKQLKANLIGTKRKAEDSPQNLAKKKKLGRPPIPGGGTKPSSDSGISTPSEKSPVSEPLTKVMPSSSAASKISAAPPQRLIQSPVRTPGLPPLCIASNPQYINIKTSETVLHLNIKNDFASYSGGCLHRVSVNTGMDPSSPLLWEALFTSPVAGCISGGDLVMIVLRDATLHMYRADGSRALSPLTLPSPVHKLKNEGNLVVCVTTSARIFVFKTDDGVPRALIKNVEVTPLNRHTTPRTSISISSIKLSKENMPIISLSDGSTHLYSDNLGCWVNLVPSRHALSLSSSLNKGPPPSLPLASLSPAPTGMTRLDSNVSDLWTCSVIESKLAACVLLKSPQEYKYWLLRLVKQLTGLGSETRLRVILQDLSRERCRPSSLAATAVSLGLDRKDLLKSALPILGSNLHLQRLYSQLRNEENMKTGSTVDLFS